MGVLCMPPMVGWVLLESSSVDAPHPPPSLRDLNSFLSLADTLVCAGGLGLSSDW